jgi:hypothetical protein
LYVLMERGTLRSVKLGGRRLIPREALDEILDNRKPQEAPAAATTLARRQQRAAS